MSNRVKSRKQLKTQAQYSMSWCPCCKYWVPTKYLKTWQADSEDEPLPRPIQVGTTVRMCENCLESTPGNLTPVFSTEYLVKDEYREQVQCPFCESWSTAPAQESSSGDPLGKDFWLCKNCGELIYGGIEK